MMRLFRVRACCLVTALVLAVGTAGASMAALLHEGGSHDPGCAPRADAPHHAGAHPFLGPSADAPDANAEHCVACHWARAFRLGTHSEPVAAPVPAAGAPQAPANADEWPAPALASVPARAPPAA